MSLKIGSTLKKLLGGLAPTLGAAFGGPMGGIAMKFLADKFTGGKTGEVEDYLLSANPEALKELKLAEIEFQQTMRELDIDLEEIAFKDRASARDLAKSRGMWPQVTLSTVFIVGYFTMMYMFITGDWFSSLDDFAKGQIAIMIGVLTGGIAQIMAFWFGSSAGSKAKTEHLAAATPPA